MQVNIKYNIEWSWILLDRWIKYSFELQITHNLN
jgi:hypothetical protein